MLSSVRVWVDSKAILRLEGLDKLKNPMASSGIEPVALGHIAWYLNQVWYRVLRNNIYTIANKYREEWFWTVHPATVNSPVG
jgi:hypothetical protein